MYIPTTEKELERKAKWLIASIIIAIVGIIIAIIIAIVPPKKDVSGTKDMVFEVSYYDKPILQIDPQGNVILHGQIVGNDPRLISAFIK